jgi:uncharacterized protein (UPF0332 family)
MIADLLTKAAKAERVARAALEDGDCDDAVSRAYYAMFNAARCLLIAEDPANAEISTHRGTLTRFSDVFIRTGRIDKRFGRMVHRAQDARYVADYEQEPSSGTTANLHVDAAAEFLAMARSLIPAAELPPPLERSPRELKIEVAKEEAGKRSSVEMLGAAMRGLGQTLERSLAEELVLYGSEDLLAAMIEKLVSTSAARSDIRALAREVGINPAYPFA